MPVSLNPVSVLVTHTFGRDHSHPPPLPTDICADQNISAGVYGTASGEENNPNIADGLPHDFDHLIRSIGEW